MPTKKIWLMWSVTGLFILYMFLFQTSISVMIPDLLHEFTIDTLDLGLLSSSYFYFYLILQMPAGILIDYYKPRRVLTIAVLICTLGGLLFASAKQLPFAIAARAIMGIGGAPAVAGSLYVVCRWFPPAYFAFIAGLAEMLGLLGGAIGQVVLAPGVKLLGWRYSIIICSVAGILLAAAMWTAVKDDAPGDPSAINNTSPFLKNLLSVLSNPQQWIIGLASGLIFAPLTAFGALWCIPYLQTLYHTDLVTAASAGAMIFIGSAFGAPLLGSLSGRIGRRRLLMIISTTLSLCLSIIIIYFPPISIATMFLLIFLFGFSLSVYVLGFALTKDSVNHHIQGAAMGFTNMLCILIGAPILQPLIGGLLKYENSAAISAKDVLFSIHDYHVAFTVIPLALTLALALTTRIKEGREIR